MGLCSVDTRAPTLTPGCRGPAQCRHGPPASSGTYRWYTCPIPAETRVRADPSRASQVAGALQHKWYEHGGAEKALSMGGPGTGRGWRAMPNPAAPGCSAPGQAPAHLDGLIGGAAEEQVPHGVDAETPDGALVAHERPLALEDLLRVIRCREMGGVRGPGPWGLQGGRQGAHTHIQGCPCSAAR